mmetsp:Transcript_13183/g.37143  ORF Transcript_13183/g.37143 Transcript_13183/m.37143 type:complete len:232 (-) Transcript_13183:1669-2364(-)
MDGHIVTFALLDRAYLSTRLTSYIHSSLSYAVRPAGFSNRSLPASRQGRPTPSTVAIAGAASVTRVYMLLRKRKAIARCAIPSYGRKAAWTSQRLSLSSAQFRTRRPFFHMSSVSRSSSPTGPGRPASSSSSARSTGPVTSAPLVFSEVPLGTEASTVKTESRTREPLMRGSPATAMPSALDVHPVLVLLPFRPCPFTASCGWPFNPEVRAGTGETRIAPLTGDLSSAADG